MTGPTATSEQHIQPDAVVQPWWRSPLNLASLAIAIAVLCGALGYVIGNNRALDDPNDTDVGYLQDMRFHHEQAVQMSLIFLDKVDTNRELRTIAREIVVGQTIEIGRMIQMLRSFGKPEVNESDIAMSWMGTAVALERMPGLATADDIDRLVTATGSAADETFVGLITAHHQGGIHMAEHAATNAATREARLMAAQSAEGQREEIVELERLLGVSRS